MQQTKRRSKKGVILLALALALFVLAIVPASAFAAASFITITNGPEVSSKTVNISYSSITPGNPGIAFVWIRDQWKGPGLGATWSALAPASPTIATYLPYVGGTTVNATYTLQSKAVPSAGDRFRVTTDFYGVAPTYNLVEVGPFSNEVVWNNEAPLSTVDFMPAGNLGRAGVNWTNGDWDDEIWAQFDELNGAPMGTTHWAVNGVPQTSLYWLANTPPAPVLIVEPPAWSLGNPYSNDGIYTVEHWAVSLSGVTQPGLPSYDSIGYDTKLPTVTWTGTDADWNLTNVPFTAIITDSGGSGVAGVASSWVEVSFNDGASWAPNVGTIANPQKAIVTTQDTFDMFKFYAKGTVAVIPNTHAAYRIAVDCWDIAGNGGVVYTSMHVDNMPPSTVVQSVSPAGSQMFMNWTNKPVTVSLLATDAGGNGAPSGVKNTQYFIGDSGSKSPVLGSTAAGPAGTVTSTTNPTSVVIDKAAPTGPVHLYYRSNDVSGNPEAWKVVWIWFDNTAPVLKSDSTGLWYTSHVPFGGFTIKLTALDYNSEIAPPGIEYQVPGWPMPAPHPIVGVLPWGQLPVTWEPLPGNPGTVWIPISAYPNSATDGIWNLQYRASDMAGNASVETSLTAKIDTRPPSTLGTAGFGPADWVDGTKPFMLTSTDQAPGAGVKVTFYRVDQGTPWLLNIAAAPAVALETSVPLTLLGGKPAVTGDLHTIDFFSIDNATTETTVAALPYPGNVEQGVAVGSWLGHPFLPASVSGYKTRTVKLDVTAPVVTAMDPKNGAWQKGPAIVNFSGTDVGSGYSHTEWSTDGGKTWTTGEDAEVGGNGEITITYHGVDNVGIKSADATILVKVASTPPTVTSKNATTRAGKKWHNPTITFTITAVTPTATAVIQIRTLSGKTISTHNYANVTTNQEVSRTFILNPPLKAGKYNIRVGAVDQAGNVQTKRGSSILTVTK